MCMRSQEFICLLSKNTNYLLAFPYAFCILFGGRYCFILTSTMIVCMIAAMSSNRVIGKDNGLPWHYSEDLKRFKSLTMWSPILMGRSTYESIGKPLPWRRNIVISRTKHFDEVELYNDPELALGILDNELDEHDKVFVIGWASLYSYFLKSAQRLYLTEIKKIYEWDTFFPEFKDHFEEVEREEREALDFVLYRKKRLN